MNKQKILLLFLCFILGFTAAACASIARPLPQEVPSEESAGDGRTFANTLELPEGPYAKFALPKLTQMVQEKYDLNPDTVGWLQLPGTTIDDVVVWYPGDENLFYYRRNFEKRESFNGIYYADYRCAFDGTAAGLAPNTVIYGHSMSDDPLDARMMFSPFKFFKDAGFAKEHPYIYFSTHDEDLLWEVFAVFYATIELPYNIPYPQDFRGLLDECAARSIYTYATEVSASDKILTLSTCTYSLPDGTPLVYPNDYRYVVMAKLVTDRSALKTEAAFSVNPSPKAP